MRVRLIVITLLTTLCVLALPAAASAGKVVNTAGHRVGWASWAKVLDKKGAMVGYVVRGRPQFAVVSAGSPARLIAGIVARSTPIRLYVSIDRLDRSTWRGKATSRGGDWELFKRVDGRWLRKGTVFGGRGVTAVAALRLLLWH